MVVLLPACGLGNHWRSEAWLHTLVEEAWPSNQEGHRRGSLFCVFDAKAFSGSSNRKCHFSAGYTGVFRLKWWLLGVRYVSFAFLFSFVSVVTLLVILFCFFSLFHVFSLVYCLVSVITVLFFCPFFVFCLVYCLVFVIRIIVLVCFCHSFPV